ncbi:MAG: radical SAM protein [Coriobacteriaceae bacterium]|nr:radical SAM protein [Coriobacteriaceae bacterium]MDO4499197.1 radical SAM protein [Coriobacteriaceae bacterium]
METSHTGSSGHESAFGLPGESGADDAMRGNRQNEPEQRPGTYILAPQVGLRSYDRLPFAYCIKGQAKPKLLDAAGFAIACKCDGSTPLPESDALRRLVEQGVAVPCEPGSVQLSGFQRLRVFPNRVIPWIALEITERCNYSCLHCFNAQGNERSKRELSLSQVDGLLDEARASGINAVLITGGEPLLHRDFREVVSAVYGRDMFVHEINTNGSLLDRETLGFLKSFGEMPDLKISFDGLGYHDWMRDCPGAEKAALRALELSVEEGFPVYVQMNVNRKNRGSILSSLCLLDRIGVSRTRLICTTESPRWGLNAQGQTMDWPEYLQFCVDTFASYAQGGHQMKLSAWRVGSLDPARRRYRLDPVHYDSARFKESRPCCSTIKGMPAVGADGSVYPCMQCSGWFDGHGICLGNVFDQGLGKIIQESDYSRMVCCSVGDRLKYQEGACRERGASPWLHTCTDCPWLCWCAGGCPALAMLASGGEFLAPDVFACEFFHGGWPQKIAQVLPGWTCQTPVG